MLAEKFFLILETLISRSGAAGDVYLDDAPKTKSRDRFVPIKLASDNLAPNAR
jgi:hypothetical protein